MPLSRAQPMRPMVITATMMRAREAEPPLWNSSHTNLPSPGFWASISAAISTIQATPSDSRSPVKIMGRAPGSTMRRTWVTKESRSTRLTLCRSLSSPATPTAVLIRVGQREQRVTVSAEVRKDLASQGLGFA
ncbi:hypothetical protein D3C85_868530 [compost metagenome]